MGIEQGSKKNIGNDTTKHLDWRLFELLKCEVLGKRFYCLTESFLVGAEGLGVVFQIFMKVVIYLAPYRLVLRPPFKHKRPPAHVKQ